MTIDRADIIRIIAAAHLDLVRDDVTAEQLTDVAVACADAILGEPDPEPTDLRIGASVVKVGARGIRLHGTVLAMMSTDGELHTVRVRWPDGFVWLYHPTELEVVA